MTRHCATLLLIAVAVVSLLVVASCQDGGGVNDSRNERVRQVSAGWNTDWSRHSVELSAFGAGGPLRDGIPSIDDPKFVSIADAREWLAGNEPVLVIAINGVARAYPLQILMFHELTNDVLSGIAILASYCPLCNAAIAFERTVDERVLEFGVSGLLRNSDMVMYDRATESLWQQYSGECIVGELLGTQLKAIPSSMLSLDQFAEAYPDGGVLSRETGRNAPYGRNPYEHYDDPLTHPFAFTGDTDARMAPKARVVGLHVDGKPVAYPHEVLTGSGAINDMQGETPVAVFHLPGVASALDEGEIAAGDDVGVTGAFDPVVDGQRLTFARVGSEFVDDETQTNWDILGRGISGPLEGRQLRQLLHHDTFWFAWFAFEPDTAVYVGDQP